MPSADVKISLETPLCILEASTRVLTIASSTAAWATSIGMSPLAPEELLTASVKINADNIIFCAITSTAIASLSIASTENGLKVNISIDKGSPSASPTSVAVRL